jgi:dienelactone hydrolase
MRVGSAVVLLALGSACAPTRTPPPAPDDGPPARVRTEFSGDRFVEMTVTTPLTPAGPKPAVVSYIADARVPLLEAGFVVVTYRQHWELLRGLPRAEPPPAVDAPPTPPPDAPPGKTYGAWLLASPSPKTVGQAYFQLIEANATGALPRVLDMLAPDPDVDSRRLGILGHSTNAFVALQGIAADPRLRVAALVDGCGDYHRFLHESTLGMNGERLDLDPAYDRWLRAREAVHHPERVVHAAILMVNGRDDRAVPASCARATARVPSRAYRRLGTPERFRFVLLDGGHAFSAEARPVVYDWLRRWLAVPPA